MKAEYFKSLLNRNQRLPSRTLSFDKPEFYSLCNNRSSILVHVGTRATSISVPQVPWKRLPFEIGTLDFAEKKNAAPGKLYLNTRSDMQ